MAAQRIITKWNLPKFNVLIRHASTFEPVSGGVKKKPVICRTDYTNQDMFSSKTTEELLRALLVLKASSVGSFVKHSDKLFLLGRRLIYEPAFHRLMKSTFYGQFAAGISLVDAEEEINKLSKAGIKSMLCVPIESGKYGSPGEAYVEKYVYLLFLSGMYKREFEFRQEAYLRNKKVILESIRGTTYFDHNGFAQMKLTAICAKELILKMNECLLRYELDHREPDEWDVKNISDMLNQQNYNGMHFASLSDDMNNSLRLLLKDLDELATECRTNNVKMMIDAEQTYLQAAINWLVLVLQVKYNQEKPIVYNTYQCYRKDTLERVKADHRLGQKYGFKIAAKLVRGAYMLEERQLAIEKNHADPICNTYDATNSNYHSIFDYVLPYILQGNIGVMVATHNEETVDYVKAEFETQKIDRDNPLLCFGQLYGICDHVSWHLGKEGYRVYKSLPYGTIDDTMLYLSRRAHENKSVLQRTLFEQFLIKKELRKRLRGDVAID